MAIIDTIEVVLEADRRGLEASMKRATENVFGFVAKLNDKKVDWQKILSKSLTPALISTVISGLAIAITQALKFQQALMASGANASKNFGANMGQITDDLLGLSSDSGFASDKVGTAFGTVNQQFKDTSLATDILAQIANFAVDQHMDLVDVTRQIIPLFESWGVKTLPEATEALSILGDATKYGTYSMSELIPMLTTSGEVLAKTGITIGETALALEQFTQIPGLAKDDITDAFNAIVNGVGDAKANINFIVGDMKSLVEKQGLPEAFQAIADRMKSVGEIGATGLGASIGIMGDTVKDFRSTAVTAFGDVQIAIEKTIATIPTIGEQASGARTDLEKMNLEWNKLQVMLQEQFGPALLEITNSLAKFFQNATSGYGEFIKLVADEGWASALMETFKALGTSWEDNVAKPMTETMVKFSEKAGEKAGLVDFFRNWTDYEQDPNTMARTKEVKSTSNIEHNTYNNQVTVNSAPGREQEATRAQMDALNQNAQGSSSIQTIYR